MSDNTHLETDAGIVYDRLRLREAITLLLDKLYGKSRSDRVRTAIKNLPKPPRLYYAMEALNEIVVIARQDPFLAIRIVDEADKRREGEIARLEKALATGNATAEERRKEVLRQNAAKYRKRVNDAIAAREKHLGRRMTSEERKSYTQELQRTWKLALEQRVKESPGTNRHAVQKAYADELNDRMRKKAEH